MQKARRFRRAIIVRLVAVAKEGGEEIIPFLVIALRHTVARSALLLGIVQIPGTLIQGDLELQLSTAPEYRHGHLVTGLILPQGQS